MANDAFEDTAGTLARLLLEDETLDSTLQRVAELAVGGIDGCDVCTVTVRAEKGFRTAAFTAHLGLEVDQGQYDTGEGPCLEAITSGELQRVDDVEQDPRWPHFTSRAIQAGVLSFLAVPLEVRGETIGALNLFSELPNGFDKLDERVMAGFAAQASVALSNAQVYDSARALSEQLQAALTSRALIERAKGFLMASEGVDADAAFALLVNLSQRSNTRVTEVAAQVLPQSPPGG